MAISRVIPQWLSSFGEDLLITAVRSQIAPQHVSIIIDGNMRFARQNGLDIVEGHRRVYDNVEKVWIASLLSRLGVPVITVWMFSMDHFGREQQQVLDIMNIINSLARRWISPGGMVWERKLKICVVGETSLLDHEIQDTLREAMALTKDNECGALNLLLPYNGRHDMLQAVNSLLVAVSRLPSQLDGQVPRELKIMFLEEGRETFKGCVLGSTVIHTAESKNIKALLATQFSDFGLGETRRRVLVPLVGNGIFTADGEAWAHSRAILRPQFTRAEVANLGLEESHMQEFLRQLPTHLRGWTNQVNINQMILRFTLDLSTEFLFGTTIHLQRYSSLQRHKSDNETSFAWTDVAGNIDSATRHTQKRFGLQGLYWLHSPKDFRVNIKEIHCFADFCVQNALRSVEWQKSNNDASPQRYIFLQELIKTTKDPIELRSQSLNILLAGRDTTASLVSWTLWLLAKHPDIYNTLRSHVLKDFGAQYQSDRITFKTLKDCKYLQYIMKEVLRLYPPTPINSRTAIRDTSLPHGGGPDGEGPIFVRKGQTVVYYVHITHTSEGLWGPGANSFDPDRWASHRTPDWTYLPFSGGPRICLGQQFALTQAGYIITCIVQKFDQAKLVDPHTVPTHRLGITDAPDDYIMSFNAASQT